MAGSLGGYTPIKVGEFSRSIGDNTGRDALAKQTEQYFRSGSAIRPEERIGIVQRQQAANFNAQQKAKEDYNSVGQRLERADAMQEGNVAIGRIGRNTAGDTRMAQVLAALGVQPDLMRAIIASAQIRPSDNR